MNNVATSMVIIPGVVALLLFLVFTYLHEQSRQQYFRAWQLGWGAYTLHFALDAWGIFGTVTYASSFATQGLLVGMGLCIFISTRLMRERYRFRWYDVGIAATGLALVWWNLHRYAPGAVAHETLGPLVLRMETWLSVLLVYCSFDFYKYAQRKSSVAFGLLGTSVLVWAGLMGFEQLHSRWIEMFGGMGHLLGPIPQMILGISMVMVLFESERNAIQENALSFSTLGVDSSRLLSAEDLAPNMQGVLDRLAVPLQARRAVICITERWRATLPSVQRGFSPEFINKLEKTGAGEYICELTYRRGGVFTFRNVAEMSEPLPAFPGSRFEQFRQVLGEENIRNVTAVSLQTREHNFGVVMFPHAERRMFGASNLRLLTGLALQIGLTLENYVVVHNTQRRTKEYELLTQIGQAISSHLDQDEVLRTIQKELGRIFDTTDFYVAFQEGDEIRFEYEVEQGKMLPKRARKMDTGLTEYVIRTGQPLLIRSDLEETRKRLNTSYIPERPAKCFCAAPIFLGGKPAGVMAVRNTEREFVFEQPDLEIMQTAAGQVSVAVEN
ncbi:MAG TPA: GAF domain-containing protein, partial [Terriglobales bacterium]|nr:GAF domain-containing protein [Terriglobales bacterium]